MIVIGFLLYVTFSAQYGNPLTGKTYIKAAVKDTHALQGKDPVRQNSKQIGRVISIDYRNGAALVTLQIEQGSDYKVYKDATAYIGDVSAVGAKFVGINPGHASAGPLPNNTIPIAQTHSSEDLYHILDIFDGPTRTETQSFVRQFGGGLGGHADGFTGFVHNAAADLTGLGTISTSLASPEANLPGLLQAADQISGRFQGRQAQIASLIRQTDTTFQSLSVDDGKALASILQKAPPTLDSLKLATDALHNPLSDTTVAMVELEPGAKGLGDSNNDLRGTFRDSIPVLDKTPPVAHQAAPALADLTPTFHHLHPLAPRVSEVLNRLATPLEVLAPYSKEIGYLFVRGNSFVSEGTAPGSAHYARLNAAPFGIYSFTGGFVKACHFQVDAYPKPGEADHDRLKLKNEPPCGVQAQGLGGR